LGHQSIRRRSGSSWRPWVEWLNEQRIPFVILANLQLGGRQIDCVVATTHSVSVVEVKSSFLPVRGDINGRWAQFHVSGYWRSYTNAYQQALAAKNVLRDAMTAMKPVGNFYPDGHVIFTSGFAEGSQVTAGDFKVTIAALDQFPSSFKLQGIAPWSLNDWHDFAAKLALTPISINQAVASANYRATTEILSRNTMPPSWPSMAGPPSDGWRRIQNSEPVCSRRRRPARVPLSRVLRAAAKLLWRNGWPPNSQSRGIPPSSLPRRISPAHGLTPSGAK
jgi:hypothetical protein